MQMRRHGVQNAAFVCVPVDLLQGVQPLDAKMFIGLQLHPMDKDDCLTLLFSLVERLPMLLLRQPRGVSM